MERGIQLFDIRSTKIFPKPHVDLSWIGDVDDMQLLARYAVACSPARLARRFSTRFVRVFSFSHSLLRD